MREETLLNPLEAVKEWDRLFIGFLERGETKALAETLYAAEARLLIPNMSGVTGHAAISAVLEGIRQRGLKAVNLRAIHAEASGDLLYSTGEYELILGLPDGSQISDHGKTLLVFRIQPDGRLLAVADMINSSLPRA